MINDFLYTGQLTDHRITFSYAVTTHMVNAAVLAHDCDPPAAHILGRALTGGVLVASRLNPGQRSNLHWKYQGSLRSLLVDAGEDGTVRGLISPKHLSEHGDSKGELFGEGGLLNHVRTEDGQILTSSTSETPLLDPVDDAIYSLCVSDQVESAGCVLIGLQPNVEQPVSLCQGLILQAMPDADLVTFEVIRARLDQSEVRDLLVRPSEVDNHFERILQAITAEDAPVFELNERPAPQFSCQCTRSKLVSVIQALPADDQADIIAKEEPVRIRCEFCNTLYEFPVSDCQRIWTAAAGG